jgi:hypothetical protein
LIGIDEKPMILSISQLSVSRYDSLINVTVLTTPKMLVSLVIAIPSLVVALVLTKI